MMRAERVSFHARGQTTVRHALTAILLDNLIDMSDAASSIWHGCSSTAFTGITCFGWHRGLGAAPHLFELLLLDVGTAGFCIRSMEPCMFK
jgi:hypothetical protein